MDSVRSNRIIAMTGPRFDRAPYRPMAHGRILPMEEPGLLSRLFNRR